MKWLRKAAEQGLAIAQSNLGLSTTLAREWRRSTREAKIQKEQLSLDMPTA